MASTGRRQSLLPQLGLKEERPPRSFSTPRQGRPQSVRFRSKDDIHIIEPYQDAPVKDRRDGTRVRQAYDQRPRLRNTTESPIPWSRSSIMYRLGATLLIAAAIVPFFRSSAFFGHGAVLPIQAVEGGVIPPEARSILGPHLEKRADSRTSWCIRWSGQSAIVNGTLYYYGGEVTTQSSQTSDTWNNDFLAFDLTRDWQIASPSITGLPQPSGPPAVALGALWNSFDSLYLYGGEFSWKPVVSPPPLSVWEYSIGDQSWIEHSNPSTSSGKNAPSNDNAVQRSAEGATVSVPSIGRGFYFGGHQDGYTTPGWSQSIPRIYLQSLLEFTFPGYTNDQVNALGNKQTAGTSGNYRNITEGGLQSNYGFTKRADGLLIYVPGFGAQGILLALAGGTNVTFTQMNNIDVYDIATSTWYKQSTSGSTPTIRVNPCAVIAAAPDGSSYNIYMFGGQNLTPYGNQSQFDDMWILTLPSFTWIEVNQNGQSVPYGRSGHTCNVWDGQMIMVGGYVGDQLSCDSPGIYVFDLSNVQWVQQFTALSPGSSSGSGGGSGSGSHDTAMSSGSSASSTPGSDFNSTGSNNPLNQQAAQIASAGTPGGLPGSYGYRVPQIVIDVIGGKPTGGATVTAPVVTATGGPLATGKPITYTVTQSNGAIVTETAGSGTKGVVTPGDPTSSHKGPNVAAIVVGVICGILFIVVCYLAFCAYLYRKQLGLYKRHVEMQQAQARGEKLSAIPGRVATDVPKMSWEKRSGNQASSNPFAFAMGDSSSQSGSGGQTSSSNPTPGSGYQSVRRDSDQSSTGDLLAGQEPTFVGVLLNPRRSLKVVNRD